MAKITFRKYWRGLDPVDKQHLADEVGTTKAALGQVAFGAGVSRYYKAAIAAAVGVSPDDLIINKKPAVKRPRNTNG